MSAIRNELVQAVIVKALALIDYNDPDKRYKYRKQFILDDKSLTKVEKSEAIKIITENYDRDNVLYKRGTTRICENCHKECYATLYCEKCIRSYLEKKFSDWTSGNDEIDDLIQKCQLDSIRPNKIIEWIPYKNLQSIKYLTKGGFSEIYIADWIDGYYEEWDSKNRELKRLGTTCKVVLKRLDNFVSANRSWFDEAKSHLEISSRWGDIVRCFGLTQDPTNKDYMLVMIRMDIDLRTYLHQNYNQIKWKERIQITFNIVKALYRIHHENAIHRDLHSGNILHSPRTYGWYISDLGFYGPADKPLNSIYGNLPYIAPEVLAGKEYTKASDIYSVGMLMWEISFGQQPFIDYYRDYDLVTKIIDGMRPTILSDIPFEYKTLMEQCWDADSLKRPDIITLYKKVNELRKLTFQDSSNESNSIFKKFIRLFQRKKNGSSLVQSFNSGSYNSGITYTKNQIFTSKIHRLENLSEQINVIEVKNVLEEEQEAFHSKPYDFNIPDDINDFIKSHSSKTSLRNSLSNKFKEILKLQKNLNEDNQSNSKGKAKQQNNDNDILPL